MSEFEPNPARPQEEMSRRERVLRAYPEIEFRARTLSFFAWLTRAVPECVHLETDHSWAAIISPDILYVQGKAVAQHHPPRPEASLCRVCARQFLERELAAYGGKVVAFEPDGAIVTQYFFEAPEEFQASGLLPELADALRRRLARIGGHCELCDASARWQWFSRGDVQNLDAAGSVAVARGRQLCAKHGAQALCGALQKIEQANLLYINIPYGESGAYLWI